ncbi:MAG: transglutaminase domain-containing protein, partial [Clostridiaceae bacterium]
MIGYWYSLKNYDLYIKIDGQSVWITVPAYDYYNKQCLRFGINSNEVWFCFQEYKFILVSYFTDKIEFIRRDSLKGKEEIIIFNSISKEEYYYFSQKQNRISMLNEKYACSTNPLHFSYNFHSKDYERLRSLVDISRWINRSSELSMIESILDWIDSNIKHIGEIELPDDRSGYSLLNYAFSNGGKLNCRGMAIVANELCMSMGLYSRFIICMQKEINLYDCHVVTIVYLSKFKKWIMIDPSYHTILYDTKGYILSIEEIRNKLSEQSDIVLNEKANYYNRKLCYEFYINALKKKFYRFISPIDIYSGCDTKDN